MPVGGLSWLCKSWAVEGKGRDGERSKSDAGAARSDLDAVLQRRALTGDEARPEAVERRHRAGRRTARENIDDLVVPGSFVEYGALAIAAQRARRELRELLERTPADGLVAGVGRVNGEQFGERAACAVLSYDYTVLAGTQGALGHRKKDRLFELIERMRLPTVFFAEGGGGRPGDTDYPVVSALDTRAFALWARLSGVVPRIAIVAGRCFAGNAVIAGCSDVIVATAAGSVTFLRERFARGMVTALARIDGRAVGLIANDTRHLAGAITSDGADKAARFMQLCDAFGLPVVSLVDTPGMMVGPEAEATGLVRHCSRLFVTGAALRVPFVAVILRKAYGLGAQAMAAGSLHEPLLTVGWPTAELGPMGLEGAVRLGFRRELESIADESARETRVQELTAAAHERAKALNAATVFELDDVIDPAETRRLIASTLAAAETSERRPPIDRRFVDTW